MMKGAFAILFFCLSVATSPVQAQDDRLSEIAEKLAAYEKEAERLKDIGYSGPVLQKDFKTLAAKVKALKIALADTTEAADTGSPTETSDQSDSNQLTTSEEPATQQNLDKAGPETAQAVTTPEDASKSIDDSQKEFQLNSARSRCVNDFNALSTANEKMSQGVAAYRSSIEQLNRRVGGVVQKQADRVKTFGEKVRAEMTLLETLYQQANKSRATSDISAFKNQQAKAISIDKEYKSMIATYKSDWRAPYDAWLADTQRLMAQNPLECMSVIQALENSWSGKLGHVNGGWMKANCANLKNNFEASKATLASLTAQKCLNADGTQLASWVIGQPEVARAAGRVAYTASKNKPQAKKSSGEDMSVCKGGENWYWKQTCRATGDNPGSCAQTLICDRGPSIGQTHQVTLSWGKRSTNCENGASSCYERIRYNGRKSSETRAIGDALCGC